MNLLWKKIRSWTALPKICHLTPPISYCGGRVRKPLYQGGCSSLGKLSGFPGCQIGFYFREESRSPFSKKPLFRADWPNEYKRVALKTALERQGPPLLVDPVLRGEELGPFLPFLTPIIQNFIEVGQCLLSKDLHRIHFAQLSKFLVYLFKVTQCESIHLRVK